LLRKLVPVLFLLIVLWATGLAALDSFPLHNDEGLHLTRAVEVWHLHPFWEITDGKIINHWLIAVFYPQHDPVFVGRFATILVAMIGLAAGYALIAELFGATAAFVAGLMWIASPYLFLYERFAFSDPEAGALIVLTLLCAFRLAQSGRPRDAILTGLALALAALFKLTAAPFALLVAVIVLLVGQVAYRKRIINLMIVAGVVLACFAIPLAYLQLHGGGFSIALGWIVNSTPGRHAAPLENLSRLWAQMIDFGSIGWSVLLGIGLVAFLALAKRGPVLILAWLLPFATILILGVDVMPRHFVVALPLALIFAGAGLAILIERLPGLTIQRGVVAIIALILALGFVPFATIAYTHPGDLPLPPLESQQYVTDHSAGFGLREAVTALPETVKDKTIPVIASMFPDSCKRANFYAINGFNLTCTAAPGIDTITAALKDHPTVYVLAEKQPVGLDVKAIAVPVTRISGYPRPGETESTASVVLWRFDR
jgi:4-amino-4-deoxy-L-arabinose transferase-like glycosyltransferase